MPDILSGYSPDTSFTQTGGGGGFSAGAPNAGGLDAFFAEMARRKMAERDAAMKEERRRFDLENARKQEAHDARLDSMAPPKPVQRRPAPLVNNQTRLQIRPQGTGAVAHDFGSGFSDNPIAINRGFL